MATTTIPAFKRFVGNKAMSAASAARLSTLAQQNSDDTLSQVVAALNQPGLALLGAVFATFTAQGSISGGKQFTVQHNLGRPPIGVWLLSPLEAALSSVGATCVLATNAAANPDLNVNLKCSNQINAGGTLTFVVF
jgi:hypothetical protein